MPFVSSHRYDALPSSEDQPRVGSLDSIRNTESDASIHQGLAEDEAAHIASEEPEIVLDATSSPNTHSVDAAHTSTDIIHRSSLVSVAESDQACSTALEEPSHNDSDRELQKLTIGWKTSALLVGFYLTGKSALGQSCPISSAKSLSFARGYFTFRNDAFPERKANRRPKISRPTICNFVFASLSRHLQGLLVRLARHSFHAAYVEDPKDRSHPCLIY
jgi:hypothetical protein